MNRAEPVLTANFHPKSPIVWVPAHAAAPRPHAFQGTELLFPAYNAYLNDVKERAASDVTPRNGAIQCRVNRLAENSQRRARACAPGACPQPQPGPVRRT